MQEKGFSTLPVCASAMVQRREWLCGRAEEARRAPSARIAAAERGRQPRGREEGGGAVIMGMGEGWEGRGEGGRERVGGAGRGGRKEEEREGER